MSVVGKRVFSTDQEGCTINTTAPRRYHILAVEDDASTLHVIAATLQDGYRISVAKTLAKAYELLAMYRYDILLLDINLPDGSGLDLCRYVIQHSETQQDIRIIFMSGLTSATDEVKGLDIGAADYIRKPINSALLYARVRLQAQLIRRNELLANLARIDALTEVPNRRAFDTQLNAEWHRALREGAILTLGMVDIDHFKAYNDTYGHPEGDKCLQLVAQVLTHNFQRSSDFVARYGGEEFAVILYDADLQSARLLFEAALTELKTKAIEHRASPVMPIVTFSAGLCCVDPQETTKGKTACQNRPTPVPSERQRTSANLYRRVVKRTKHY